METRNQKHARAAYARVKAVEGWPVEKKYGALALNFPVMVLQSGLAQATGFLLAKGREEHLRYLDDLADVLGEGNGQGFHGKIIASDLGDYQDLTRRTLEAAGWFKRYAQGILKAESTDGEST
ncbi:type III-B CRISPR module-associated protein Cmr5 [Candidatus Accumulibacter cognatus]|uniref:CRISPR type III-B/RAMP module-associated protein Cmr5 n=1 Tax=Candidatus Accumulibacter cognatus TaxID=2954383 RepID=A0A080MH87_9PROT|nr:type III-B CRISPR module-associated protein Cmr5 [Candidatus Accumulibacter cognatus]KFB76594.1 MAG: CRISPR type III-B/RAMP module-associated protein Cmr5 [Candidatus Accumulibacter cognatus]